MNADKIFSSLDRIAEIVKKVLPEHGGDSIFDEITTIKAALDEQLDDQKSTDPFRNRAHAALMWVIVACVAYNYFLSSIISVIIQLSGKSVTLPPVDGMTIVTLVGLVLFGKAIVGGYSLVDTIHQRIINATTPTPISKITTTTEK